MKILIILICALTLTSCSVNTKQSTDIQDMILSGEKLPSIRHVTEMKITGDTLWFVYETEDGHGQRFLRRALIDCDNHQLIVSSEIGRRDNGYYTSYMPYPFIADNGTIRVVSQDDCEIYSIENDTTLVRTTQYLMEGNSIAPFPLSQYVQDLFTTGPNQYVFIGREPNGGRQYAMKADLTISKIDTIRQINRLSELQAWMSNIGELAYSNKHNRLAFAYKLHPIIEISDMNGNIIKSIRTGEDTFNPRTLEDADLESFNILHNIDVTYNPDYIYTLYWNCRYDEATTKAPTIYKIDWEGNVVKHYSNLPGPLYRIAEYDNKFIIGWNGNNFVCIPAP